MPLVIQALQEQAFTDAEIDKITAGPREGSSTSYTASRTTSSLN